MKSRMPVDSFLVLAEGLVIHEEPDELVLGRRAVDPLGVAVGHQRVLGPLAVREAERDVVREEVVAQVEELELSCSP
jgi:hypothetical protein